MKILLLGGTGAMGIHLSEILSRDKKNVITVTSRSLRKSNGNVNYVNGNAHDTAFLQKLLSTRWDVIVDFMVYSTDEFNKRIDLLLNSTEQYVFLSSSRVYADSHEPITEESPRLLDTSTDTDFLNTDEYALTKARQEDMLIKSGMANWTIIRPYITYAENRLQLGVLELKDWLPRALQGRTIVFSEDIATKYTTLTYGLDVALGIASIISNPRAYGRKFHITCDKSIKWSEVLNIYLDVIEESTGSRPKVRIIPVCPNVENINRKYQVVYDRQFNRIFDSSSISEFCPVSNFTSPEKGLRKCIQSFIKNNIKDIYKYPLDFESNVLYDRIAGEHTMLRYLKSNKDKIKYILFRNAPRIACSLSDLHNRLIKR